MALIDKASLLMVPSTYEDGTLYNVLPSGNKAPDETGNHNGYDQTRADFTFSRGFNLTATRVNANGLIEKGRENLLLQSNQFDTTWSVILGGNLSGGQSGYDGSNDAWRFTKASGQSSRIYQNITLSSTLHTTSIYAKAGTLQYLAILEFSGSFVYFDLQNGTIGTISGSPIDVKIEAVGATGWYRCSVTDKYDITQLRIYATDTDGSISGSGNIYIQDAQVENSLVATPVIRTGATTATAGILENTPRIDYSSGAGALLLEPQRTNRVINSEYFDASEYNYVNAVTRTPNAGVSPDGFNNAYLVTEVAANAVHRIGQAAWGQNVEDTSVSIFAKSNGTRYIVLGNANMSPSMNTWFDLENGVVGTESPDIIDASIEPFENGWYRCSISYLPNKGNTYPTIYLADSDGGSLTYVGDGVSGVYLFGYQIEYGSYVSSYVPTYGSAATIGADSCSVTGASDVIGQTEGTLYAEINLDELSADNRFILTTSNASQSEAIFLRHRSSNDLQFYSAGLTNNFDIRHAITSGGSFKLAAAYKSGDIAFYVNGVQIGTDTPIFSTPSLSVARLGTQVTAGFELGGGIKQAILFNERLSNTELAALTA